MFNQKTLLSRPHIYTCSCPDFYKYKGTSWCGHIHMMHLLTKGRFKEKMCLYIQTDNRYMLIRHVRAFILGQDFMRCMTVDCFEEVVDYLDASSKYKVSRLKNDQDECQCLEVDKCIICEGCRCRFTCTCPDFIIDKQVCQHIHSVFMLKRKILFNNLEIPRLEFSYSLTATQDWNLKYYVPLEHEMSLYIDLKNIVKQKGSPPANLCVRNAVEFSSERNVDSDSERSSDSDEKTKEKRSNQDSWWIIYRKFKSGKKKEECRVRSHF